MRTLVLPALLACAALAGDPDPVKSVNGLNLQAWMEAEFASVGGAPVRVTLYNVSGDALLYRLDGDRPAIELRLTRKGEPTVRKPLPKDVQVHRPGGDTIPKGGHAWLFMVDLTDVFGALQPGAYALEVVHASKGYRTDAKGFAPAEIAAGKVAFEIIETSLDDARQKNPASKDVALRLVKLKDGTTVARMTNLGKGPLTFFAYTQEDEREPLSSLLVTESWTGRRWTGAVVGFCGTGLVRVTLHPGQTRDLMAPVLPAGIVRLTLEMTDPAGRAERSGAERVGAAQ